MDCRQWSVKSNRIGNGVNVSADDELMTIVVVAEDGVIGSCLRDLAGELLVISDDDDYATMVS